MIGSVDLLNQVIGTIEKTNLSRRLFNFINEYAKQCYPSS